MFFEKNAQALLQTDEAHASLLSRLQATAPTTAYQIYQSGDDFSTLEYKGIFLHNPNSPVEEVRDLLASNCHPGADRLHVILGLGLGYLLDETYSVSEGHIMLYEPDLPFLRFMLENVDLSALLGSGRVWIVDTQVDLLTQIRKQLYRQYQLDVLVLRGHAHLMAAEIPTLMERITELEKDRIYDAQTGRSFHFQWLRQFLTNLPELAKIESIDNLYGRFEGKPALVISRGPSLDGALDAIRESVGSTVLIAVGGAVRRLYEANIIPDFALFYDANGMQEQLHGIPDAVLEKITFLVSPFSQPCVFKAPSHEKMLFLGQNNAQLADWLDVTVGRQHQRIDGGGTVSIIGFQVALAMACNPVILVGQDLAFPGNQVYAGGIQLEQNAAGDLALTPSETLYAQPETMDTTVGQKGETLPTLKAYTSFIRHLEDMAIKNAQKPNPTSLYNASLGGARIDGFPLYDLADLKKDFPEPWKASYALPAAPGLSVRQIEDRRLAFQKGLLDLKAQLQQAQTLCSQLAQSLQVKHIIPQDSVTTIQSTNRHFNEFIGRHPFVGYWFMFEMMDFRDSINRLTSTHEFIQQGYPAIVAMIDACQAIIQQKALPWVEETYQTMALQKHSPEYQATVSDS
jgi:hypothetical protein